MVSAPLQCILLCTSRFCLPQVAPVTYLRMSSHPKLYTAQGRTLSAFPLGMSLTFTVQFYNSVGEKFHTHNTQLYLALNRYGRQRNGVDIVVDILLINLVLSKSTSKFLSYPAVGIWSFFLSLRWEKNRISCSMKKNFSMFWIWQVLVHTKLL